MRTAKKYWTAYQVDDGITDRSLVLQSEFIGPIPENSPEKKTLPASHRSQQPRILRAADFWVLRACLYREEPVVLSMYEVAPF